MKKKLKILFLEDSESDAELNLRALKKGNLSFESIRVDTKKDYITALSDYAPDAIISDHTLPQFNSQEALQILKNSNFIIPFILVTGTVSEEFAVTCLKEGANDYLLKGNLARLPSALINAIEKNQARKEQEITLDLLQKNERHLNTVLNTVVDGIITINESGSILSYNLSAEKMFGFPNVSVIGKNIKLLMQISFFTVQDKYFNKINPEGSTRTVDIGRDVTGKRMNGSTFPVELTIGETVENDVKIFVMAVRDVSERKDSEEKLKAKNQELSTYVYRTSHDLRGPVASVIGLVDIAKQELADNKTAFEFLNMIEKSSKKLDDVLSGLIEVTRISDGKSLNSEINFKFIIDEILSNLEIMKGYEEIEFKINVNQKNVFTNDIMLFRSVIYNLLHNSINYRNKKLKKSIIGIDLKEMDHSISIEISDNGTGISEKITDKVFEMFYRGRVNSPGTGLGLYIVKTAVEKMGGSVEFNSNFGKGTKFKINLPSKSN